MTRFITYFLFISLNGFHCWAAPVLTEDSTFRRAGVEIDFKEANSVLTDTASAKAGEIFDFFEKKISPLIPENFKTKMEKRTVHIEFQKNLGKGAMFIESSDETAPLVLRVRAELVNDPSFYRLLAHEWFHALHFVVHKDEPAWLREGLAQVFENMVMDGYNGQNLIEALDHSTTPLEAIFDVNQESREAYGHVFLYFYYLYQKCGKQPLFWKIVEGVPGKFGEGSVEFALSQMKDQPVYCSSFRESVIHAELARAVNRHAKIDGKNTDEFLVIPELIRSLKDVLTEKDVPTTMASLDIFEPKIFQASAQKLLSKYTDTDSWAFYTLQQGYPHLVSPGMVLDPKAATQEQLIFVMKLKELTQKEPKQKGLKSKDSRPFKK